MKKTKRSTSLLLVLVLLMQLMGTAFAADQPLRISPAPNRAPEYTMQEGDIIFIPGAALAGTKSVAYVMLSATAAPGQKVTVAIPEGTDKADGTNAAAGPKGNVSGDRFWGVKGGKLTRIVGTWESTKNNNPFAYKVGYHDTLAALTDTTIRVENNTSHNGGGNCAHNFNAACGEKSSTNRYAECAAALNISKELVIVDLRHAVVSANGKAVTTLGEVKDLCGQGLAAVNCFVPDGTKAGGTVQVLLVVDFEAKAEPADMNVPVGETAGVGRGNTVVLDFNGGGTLQFNRYGCLNISGAVDGKTELTMVGTPAEVTYVTAPSATPDDAFFYNGTEGKLAVTDDGTAKRWSITGLPDVGLKITASEGVTLQLHTGTMQRSPTVSITDIIPVSSQTAENGQVTYYFKHLDAGIYHYSQQGEGYYTVVQNIDYTEQDSKEGRTITAAPVYKKNGNGFEPTGYILPTEEFMEKALPSSSDQWGEEYKDIFTTPYFLRDKSQSGMHQQTTQQEMMDFIHGLDEENDNLYFFDYGKSPKYGYEIPIVVFTKENIKGKTLEEVAELFKANHKPTLHYQGQIHSNEVAGGETTLAFIKQFDGAYGDKVLDTMDVYFIPRINPDGAHEWIRASAKTKDDMNRDFMAVENEEVRLGIGAYNLFRPEVTIVTHEQQAFRDDTNRAARIDDVAINVNGGARSIPEVEQTIMKLLEDAKANVEAKGLRAGTYNDYAYAANTVVDNGYFGARGSFGMLTETLGINAGTNWFERRVAAAYTAQKTLIDYVAANPDSVVDLVRRNRADLIAKGEKYEEDDLFVASWSASRSGPAWTGAMLDQYNGEVADPNYTYTLILPTQADIKLTRSRPTAYVIPKSMSKAAEVIALMDKHDIKWYELPAGSAVKLQQYVMPAKSASLTPEQVVTFKDGAYVFNMNQDTANILGLIMEPDSVGYSQTGVKCNLVDMKFAEKDANGYLPIYRYCHDLVDGKITVEEACKGGESCPAAKFTDVDASAWYHNAVDSMLTNGIMSGYNDTTFGTNDSLTRAMVVQVLYNRMGTPEVKTENKFSDVAEGSWYCNAVRWAADKGIVAGYGDGKFGPEDEITIEQAAVILYNYSGKPKEESDLSTVGTHSEWAAEALCWCQANGVLQGVPFANATETATRAQTAQMLMNFMSE